jgi:ParB family chromosome partitioning protein
MTDARRGDLNVRMVSLSEVPETPGPYTMSFDFDLAALGRSIERVGVINRPIVERDEEGGVRVVAGYRRLMALKALQCRETPCTDLTTAGLPFLQKLHMALHDNLATRDFNDVEKAMALERLVHCVPRKEVISSYMPLLGLACKESLLETYLAIPRLDTGTKLALSRKEVSLQSVHLLLDLDQDSRLAVSKWFTKLKFSINHQREFIEYVSDIAHRDGLSISTVLSDRALSSLLEDEKKNQPQRVQAALKILRRRRFPILTHAERSFRSRIQALKLPPGVRIEHPPGFEAPEYRLDVRFSDGEMLKRRLLEIAGLPGLEKLQDPWKMKA